MTSVDIVGDHNVVGNHNVVVQALSGPPEGHVNGVDCPQCFVWAWRSSNCWRCETDVRSYYDAIQAAKWEENRRKHDRRVMLREVTPLMAAGGLVLLTNMTYFRVGWLFVLPIVFYAAAAFVARSRLG